MTFTLLVPVKRHRKLNTALFEAPHLQKIQLDFSRTVFLQRVKDVCGGQRTRSQPSSPPPPRSPQEAWRGLTEHVLQTDQAGHKVVKVDGEVLLAIASHDGLMQRVVQAETYAAGSNGQRSGGLRRDEGGAPMLPMATLFCTLPASSTAILISVELMVPELSTSLWR